jgi:hypothetical protein
VGFIFYVLISGLIIHSVNVFRSIKPHEFIKPFELKFRKPIAILKIQSETEISRRHRFGNRRQ